MTNSLLAHIIKVKKENKQLLAILLDLDKLLINEVENKINKHKANFILVASHLILKNI